MTEKLLKYQNMKLRNQLIFTLPASQEVCGRECPGCYAIKAQKRFPKTVPAYRQRMLDASKGSLFPSRVVKEIKARKTPVKAVRVHESGEFYSQTYVNHWTTIAKTLPDQKFYAFTKRKKDFDFSKLEALPNFVLIDSMKFKGLNYGSKEDMMKLVQRHGCKICPATLKDASTTCGVSCEYCWSKEAQDKGVCFVKH